MVAGQHQAATGTPLLCIFMNCITAGPAASVAIFCCRDQDTAGAFSQKTLSNEWPQWLPMTNTSHSLRCWCVKAFTDYSDSGGNRTALNLLPIAWKTFPIVLCAIHHPLQQPLRVLLLNHLVLTQEWVLVNTPCTHVCSNGWALLS